MQYLKINFTSLHCQHSRVFVSESLTAVKRSQYKKMETRGETHENIY